MPLTIVTHDGKFHADDVLACGLLLAVHEAEGADVSVVRTRDHALTAYANDRIVVDVGGAYDPQLGLFDHHQAGAPKRDDDTPYSAFGLVWKEYGRRFVADVAGRGQPMYVPDPKDPFAHLKEIQDIVDRVAADVDAKFVVEIDSFDNGIGKPQTGHVSNLVETLAPRGPFASGAQAADATDAAFMEAVAVMRRFLDGYVLDLVESWRSVREFEKRAVFLEDGRVAVLPEGMPWKRAVFELGLEDLLYVVLPKEDGKTWYCNAVPDKPGSFGQRKSFPETWAGLQDAGLADVCGVEDAVFCHRARFICAARSKDGAIRMARIAVS